MRRVHDGNRGGFHLKFAFKVSSPSFLFASILNRAGWSVKCLNCQGTCNGFPRNIKGGLADRFDWWTGIWHYH